DHNIYRWAGSLLTAISKMVPDVADATPEAAAVPDQADESLEATEREIARENYFATLRLAAG
ncbi:trehalose-6-phosphate synthase, partial [Gemmata sp. JC717]|nr:trehalose-6-phosphate synthase [Gemmata algarum]